MPRPKKNTKTLLANMPSMMLDAIRNDAIAKGYTINRRGVTAPYWQGYLGAIFSQIINGEWTVPKKDSEGG